MRVALQSGVKGADLIPVWTDSYGEIPGLRLRFRTARERGPDGKTVYVCDEDGCPVMLGWTAFARGPQGSISWRTFPSSGLPAQSLSRAYALRTDLQNHIDTLAARSGRASAGAHPGPIQDPDEAELDGSVSDRQLTVGAAIERYTREETSSNGARRGSLHPLLIGLGTIEGRRLDAGNGRAELRTEAELVALGRGVRYDLLTKADFRHLFSVLATVSKIARDGQPVRDAAGFPIRRYRQSQLCNGFKSVVNCLLDFCVEEGTVGRNHCRGVHVPRAEPTHLLAWGFAETLTQEDRAASEAAAARVLAQRLEEGTAPLLHFFGIKRPRTRGGAGMAAPGHEALTSDIVVSSVCGVGLVHADGCGDRFWATGMRVMVVLATQCGGPRIGELVAAKWGDVDIPGRKITYTDSFHHVRRAPRSPRLQNHLKGGKPPRRADLTDEAIEALEAWREEYLVLQDRHWGDQLAYAASGGVLLPTVSGKVLEPTMGNLLLQQLQARAGVPVRRSHTYRATYTSLQVHAGVPITQVARDIGDTVAVVMRCYLSWLQEHEGTGRRAAESWRKKARSKAARQASQRPAPPRL